MRLLSCDIENFGKLEKLHIDFESELHIIMEENGWGKSTLAAFIKVMFYGFSGDGKRSIGENERKKYKPWQGGVYGGRLCFETGGKKYEIARTFGAKEKDDTFSLYDMSTNMESSDFSERIGEELFLIDSESFARTVYIPQSCASTGTTDSISAKIGNLTDNTDDINNYENVQKKLKDMLNAMSPARATGEIKKLEKKIADTKVNIMRADEMDASIKRIGGKLSDEIRQRDILKKNQAQVSAALKKAGEEGELKAKKEMYLKINETYEKAIAAEEKLKWRDDNIPEGEEINDYIKLWGKISKQKSIILSKTSALEALRITAEVREKERTREREKTEKIKKLKVFAAVTGIIAGIAFILADKLIPGVLFGVAGLLMAGSVLTGRREYDSEDDYSELEELSDEIEKLREYVSENEEKTAVFLERYGFLFDENTAVDKLYEMKNKLLEYRRMREGIANALYEKQTFEKNNDVDRIINYVSGENVRTVESLNREMQEIGEKLDDVNENIMNYNRQLEVLQEEKDVISEEETALEKMEKERDVLKRKHYCLTLTKDLLEKAKESFTAKYIEPVMSGFDKYYRLLTHEDSGSYRMDANINVNRIEKGDSRDIGLLSRGYQDIAGICLRMALVDAMYKGEKPFVIFDDPFVNLDGEKTAGGKRLLKEIAKEYQVIYFACNESRLPQNVI